MTSPVLARPAREGEPGYPGRVYEHPVTHELAPSITGIEGIMDKPALKYWAARQCAEYAADHLDSLNGQPRTQVIDLVRRAPWASQQSSAKAGDTIHDAIDRFAKTREIPSKDTLAVWPVTERRMWKSFLAFVTRYHPSWVESEFTVWSHTYGYAGTADWCAYINGQLVLADTKTGKATYPEVGLQLAAIANADCIIEPDGTERPIPRFDRYAVLHIRPTFARLAPVRCIDDCFDAFRALRVAKHWKDAVSAHVVADAPKIESPIAKVA